MVPWLMLDWGASSQQRLLDPLGLVGRKSLRSMERNRQRRSKGTNTYSVLWKVAGCPISIDKSWLLTPLTTRALLDQQANVDQLARFWTGSDHWHERDCRRWAGRVSRVHRHGLQREQPIASRSNNPWVKHSS